MPWLEKTRPDLLPLYDELYPGSYAPKARQRELSRLVGRLVARHGGTVVAPTETRQPPPPPRPRPRKPDQLGLGL